LSRRAWLAAAAVVVVLLLVVRAAPRPAAGRAAAGPVAIPAWFEENRGQLPGEARWLARSAVGLWAFDERGATLHTRSGALRVTVPGAEARAPLAEAPRQGKVNVLRGSDPSRWLRNIPTFAALRYPEVRPGVDLVFRPSGAAVEYDLRLAPGVDPAAVEVALEGAESLEVDAAGDLHLVVGGRPLVQRRPRAFQGEGSARREVAVAQVARLGGRIAFRVEGHDPARALVIDPVITESFTLGGTDGDSIAAVAVTGTGALLVAGSTISQDLPTTPGALQQLAPGGTDVFVALLDPAQAGDAQLRWATYLGGPGEDSASGLALAWDGTVVVVGHTSSGAQFPQRNDFSGGIGSAFMTHLSEDGSSLVWSSRFGGTGPGDLAHGVVQVGAGLEAVSYVVGTTTSTDFPVVGGDAHHGGEDGFLVAVAESPTPHVTVSTLVGGPGDDGLNAVAADDLPAPHVYVGGYTWSDGLFTSIPAFQPERIPGGKDGLLLVYQRAPFALVRGSYLGSTGNDEVRGLASDVSGNLCVAGEAGSSDLLSSLSFVPVVPYGGGQDGFVVRFLPSGAPAAMTFVGGPGYDSAAACALSGSGIAAVGLSDAGGVPGLAAFQEKTGTDDGFVATFTQDLALRSVSPLGGGSMDSVRAVAWNGLDLVVAGQTSSTDYPVTDPLAASALGGGQAFVTILETRFAVTQAVPDSGPAGLQFEIRGRNFPVDPQVRIDGTVLSGCATASATAVRCAIPVNATPGPKTLTVQDLQGFDAEVPGGFMVFGEAPTLTAVAPGTARPGDVVTLTGTNFLAGAQVQIGSKLSTTVTWRSAAQVDAKVPSLPAGTYDVWLVNTDTQAVKLSSALVVEAAPGGGADPAALDPYACGSGSAGLLALLGAALPGLLRRRRRSLALLAVALAVLPALASAQARPAAPGRVRPRIAVLPLKAGLGIDAQLADVVTDALVAEVQSRAGQGVVSSKDLEAALGFERKKQVMGCAEDTSCLAEIGGALGVEELVTGQVARVGKTLVFTATRVDARRGVAVRRYHGQLKDASDDALLAAAAAAAAELYQGGAALPQVAATPATKAPAGQDPATKAPPASAAAGDVPLPPPPRLASAGPRFAVGVRLSSEVTSAGGAAALTGAWRASPRWTLGAGALWTGAGNPGALARATLYPAGGGGRLRFLLAAEADAIFADEASVGLAAGPGVEWAFRRGAIALELPVQWLAVKPAGADSVFVLPAVTAHLAF
jgi:TolB-like protein